MASRKEQKEAARAQRLAEEQARSERERMVRRLQLVAGVVIAALAVVGVAVAVSIGGAAPAGLIQNSQDQKLVIAATESALTGIPQLGTRLGNPRAPVTMTYYGDLECPVCKAFTLQGGFPQLLSTEIRHGKVQVDYRAFKTASPDPTTFQTQQVAALAAGKQNHFWDYIELFYHQQGPEGTGYVTETYLQGLAKQVPGLNFSAWQSARNDPTLVSQVQSDQAAGATAGVQGTPTLIMHGPRGTRALVVVPDYPQLQQAIKAVA
jgi:protein-disulfide isomerase